MPGHALDALADDRQRVLGQVDQDRARLRDGVAAQAGRAGGHAEGQVQPQPGLGALRRPADHADRRGAPQLFHQPGLSAAFAGDLCDAQDRKRRVGVDQPCQALAFFLEAARGRDG